MPSNETVGIGIFIIMTFVIFIVAIFWIFLVPMWTKEKELLKSNSQLKEVNLDNSELPIYFGEMRWREEYEKLLTVLVRANAVAEYFYSYGTGSGHPSIQKYYEARQEFIDWRIKQKEEILLETNGEANS